MSHLAEPEVRYRRTVDHYECPICGKTLGERSWDSHGQETRNIYVDSGPTYYNKAPILPKTRTFKPCGCQSTAELPASSGVPGEDKPK